MSVTAGAISKTLIGQTTAQLTVAAATSGTGPYTYQWYQSTVSGFSPGAGNLVAGQTALVGNFSGLTPGVTYYYSNIATDTGAGNATSTSASVSAVQETGLSQNQFAQNPIVGVVDLALGPTNVIAAQVDVSVTTQIYPGQGVKIVSSSVGGIPKVAPVSSKSDACIGFAKFTIKDLQYVAGQNLEVALWGSVVWCYATGAISQFGQACLDPTYVGGVQASGNSATAMGWAYDGAASGGGLIRVMLMPNASFATA